MKAIIITIGDEILIGQIIDTNSAYIANELDKIGIETIEMLSISDKREHIIETLNKVQNKTDLVVITGGLGPTKDDVTKKTLCEYFNDKLIYDSVVLKHVTELIEKIFQRPITQLNKDQALVPSKAKVLFNEVGTAPGLLMKKEKTVFVSLPGVPYEMKQIITSELVPYLITAFERDFILHQTITTMGLGESLLAEHIEEWENQLPDFISLAYLPSPGKVKLRLTARGKNENFIRDEIKKHVESLKPLIDELVVSYNEEQSIEIMISDLLKTKGLSISTAESFTGGKISQILTSVPGASTYFKGGIVAYDTCVKTNVLGVSQKIIDQYSVVSLEVAKEMAIQCQKIFGSDISIATTGNAGPLKGDSDKEVGTVCLAILYKDTIFAGEYNFGQPREKVVDRAVSKVLEILYKDFLKN